MRKLQVLLVDDHSLVRAGIREMINGNSTDTEVIAETDNGRDGLKIINSRDIVYYLSVTAFSLLAATRMLEARRWR